MPSLRRSYCSACVLRLDDERRSCRQIARGRDAEEVVAMDQVDPAACEFHRKARQRIHRGRGARMVAVDQQPVEIAPEGWPRQDGAGMLA